MDFNKNEKNWEEKTNEIFLEVNKKVYISVIFFYFVSILVFLIQTIVTSNLSYLESFVVGPILLIILIIITCLINKIKSKLYGDITYFIILFFYDCVAFYVLFKATTENDDQMFIRIYYHMICYVILFLNMKSDNNWLQLIIFVVYKIIVFSLVFYIYDYKKFLKSYFVFDVSIIIFTFGTTFVVVSTKRIVWKSIQKLNQNNISLNNKLKNIINTMKSPLLSLNLRKNSIIFNQAFIKFIKEYFDQKEFFTDFLFDEGDQIDDLSLDNLLHGLNIENIHLLNQIGSKKKKDEHKEKKLAVLKKKILIINKIFLTFSKESDLNTKDAVQHINFFDLIRDENSKEEEFFEHRGEFKISLTDKEKFIEISWRKNIYNNKEEVLDVMLNDITSLKEIQFSKADIKYRKIYLAKIAHEFKTPINLMICSIKDLINKFPLIKDETQEKLIKFILGQANFISILIHDINDYSKDINDFEINLESFQIREVINFAFGILECLVNKDQYKKDNVKLFSNISANVPQTITSDERRLKQLLVNLISNSVKFTNFGQVSINVNYENKNDGCKYDEVKFTIEDTGIGIKTEDQDKLFKEYSNLNKEYFSMNKEGAGLGLSICKKIVQKLGSTIYCESKNNTTKFCFSIFNKEDKIINSEQVVNSIISEEVTILIERPYLSIEKLGKLNEKFYNNSTELNFIHESDDLILKKEISEKPLSIVKPKSSNKSIKIIDKKGKKIENLLLNILKNVDYEKFKMNFLKFNKPLINYSNFITQDIENLEFVILVDDDIINVKTLSNVLKNYYKSKNIDNIRIISLHDGIEALNLLYFDILFFMKISMIVCDLNMKFMNGDLLFKVLKQLNDEYFLKIKFVMYTNMDLRTVMENIKGLKYCLRKPCSKVDIEKLYDSLK